MFKCTSGYSGSFSEIVEIKALRLPIFVVRNHKVSNGLGRDRGSGVATLLALGLALKLLRPLLLAGPFLLSLGKCRARASSHVL